jgi:predicted DCC family thiol-disulfide oxidoreductase YuxK
MAAIPEDERAALLYDAECGFCRWALAKIMAWDRRGAIRPVPLQDPEADLLLAGMPQDRRMASWHLVTPDGRVTSAGGAVPGLMERLPAGAPLALLSRTFPRTTDRLYLWVARNRDRLGRRLGPAACSVDPAGRAGAR